MSATELNNKIDIINSHLLFKIYIKNINPKVIPMIGPLVSVSIYNYKKIIEETINRRVFFDFGEVNIFLIETRKNNAKNIHETQKKK